MEEHVEEGDESRLYYGTCHSARAFLNPRNILNLGVLVRSNFCVAWNFATYAQCMHVEHCMIIALPFPLASARKR